MNQLTYTALEFAALDPADIQSYRYSLFCTECGGPGYFRKSSTSGQGPCFGARPHLSTCTLLTSTGDPWGEPGDDLVQSLEADQTKIVLSLGSTAAGGGDGDGLGGQDARSGRRFALGSAPQRSIMRRNPDKLLRMLVASQRFRTSRLVLSALGADIAVGDFFVHFSAVSVASHLGKVRGFWGVPYSVKNWKGLTYVNTGSLRSTLSFWLPQPTIDALVGRYALKEIGELANRNVLIIGKSFQSTTGKFTLDVLDPKAVGVV